MSHAPSMAELQRWFKQSISPRAGAPSPALTAVLNPQGGEPGVQRLAVYAGGYVVRIRAALAEVYEAVRWAVGEPVFARLAEAYARRHPSQDYNLSAVGRHLPAFLEADPVTQRLPFLPDLARLEWTVCRAFHAFERPPCDAATVERLALSDGESVRLIFQPAVAVVTSAWPILDCWTVRRQPREQVDLEIVNRPQHVRVFRRGVEVRCEVVSPDEAQALSGLLAGKAIGDVYHELAASRGEPSPPLVAEWFARWMRDGMITDLVWSP